MLKRNRAVTLRRSRPLIDLAIVGLLVLAALVESLAANDVDIIAPEVLEENKRCLNCHAKDHIATLSPADRFVMVRGLEGAPSGETPDFTDAPATRPELYIDFWKVFVYSLHGQQTCISCHRDCNELPHPVAVDPAVCTECHPNEVEQHAASVHGRARRAGDTFAATCSDCHGAHDILSSANPQSRTYKLNLPFTCARCHTNQTLMESKGVGNPLAAQQYLDSMHARGLLADGLIVAPSCSDCHGVHEILPSSDPRSRIHKHNVPETCGVCHKGVETIYRQSVHGRLLEKDDEEGPVCVTCHTAHEIVRPSEAAFKLRADERCGECHEDRLHRYRETFHGKAMALQDAQVAACYDCHGHHDILPASDPASRLHPDHRVATCQQCHPRANANFAQYYSHADHLDRENYPVLFWTFVIMTTIVLGTFAFFSIHSVLWLVRSLVFCIRNPMQYRAIRAPAPEGDEQFVRFRPVERFLHILVMLSFLLLVATGMPLKFYDAPWAEVMVRSMGGVEVTSGLHRIGAIITFSYFAIHLLTVSRNFIRNRKVFRSPETGRYSFKQAFKVLTGPDMPVPHLNDLKDWWAHQRWFLGLGPQPSFDRWTYWEKFDYLAVFWGVAVIGLSGLVLWFPEVFSQLFPGWLINVCVVIHSDEALLAAGFIFAFHFFNVHFRLEKFPLDPVIFSGRISKKEMLHERKRWYDRLVAEGRLDSMRVKDEWSQWKKVMHPVGYLGFTVGTLLLFLIIYAMGVRLLMH
ncbi:MAG: hypothetical protein KDC38_02590 [Planctomycetes bacterium]|nr:hypothetical protein [Planctomycetota bacterium]